MSSTRKLRPSKKPIKYYSTEETSADTSDSSYSFSPQFVDTPRSKNKVRDIVHNNLKRLYVDDSFSSQDSETFTSPLQPQSKRVLNHKKDDKTLKKTLNSSQQTEPLAITDGESSDSSFLFTDEISEASSVRKEHPNTLSKNELLQKSRRNTTKKEKSRNLKRKDLSASLKTAKKLKFDKVEIKPDPEPETDHNSSQFCDEVAKIPVTIKTEQNQDEHFSLGVQIKQEKFSPIPNQTEQIPFNVKIKEEPPDPKPIKKEKSRTKKIKAEPSTSVEKDGIKTTHVRIKTEKTTNIIEPKIKIKNEYKLGSGIEWQASMLAELMDLDFFLAKSIISLFQNDCTIPFIARYRRDYTHNMDADQLRHVKDAYEYIKSLETKAQTVLKQLQKNNKLTKSLENSIYQVRSIEELDYIYAPYKQGSSKSKAEKARGLGLEQAALIVLNGTGTFTPSQYKDSSKPGLKSNDEVIQSVQNIMADIFSKDEAVLEYIHEIENGIQITVKSSKLKSSGNKKSDEKSADDDAGKYRLYYDFQRSTKDLQPHQILALNRGENQKVLSVKMQVSDYFYQQLYKFCFNKWLKSGCSYPLRTTMFNASFKDSYNRLITPLLIRRTRSKLNRQAQQTAIENFAMNLKSLLQTSPVKGCSILGIDPGIRHGVKLALISKTGQVLWTSVLNFDFNNNVSPRNEQHMLTIKKAMTSYSCELIALGNGTGCRAIENIISDHLTSRFFQPELNVEYTIVNERGASIYSCSAIAREEFPDLDPNLISAVFIARSLQDPLSEYVKVEPKHLGVGMYQHDMPLKELHQALDEIVVECVSFTGVDVNTASIHLLKRIAGLSASKAGNIIEYRITRGPFKNRDQLHLVKGIGPKSFEQCAGFIRIHPQTCYMKNESDGPTNKSSKKKLIACSDEINPLDRTWIHPESYAIAYLFLDQCNVKLADLGAQKFIDQIKKIVDSKGIPSLAQELNQSEDLITLIYEALTKPNDYDYRSQFSKPMFSKGLTKIENLSAGIILQGRVGNVTNFGAFVDIGVGKDGLIHISNMNRITVQVGDQVQVKVLNIEVQTARISLQLLKKF